MIIIHRKKYILYRKFVIRIKMLFFRMNHHQQRMNHHHQPQPNSRLNQHLHHNGIMGNVGGQQQQQATQPNHHQTHHQPPPQIMPKHLHQNIATLNHKPHLSSNNSNSHQITTPRMIQSIESKWILFLIDY